MTSLLPWFKAIINTLIPNFLPHSLAVLLSGNTPVPCLLKYNFKLPENVGSTAKHQSFLYIVLLLNFFFNIPPKFCKTSSKSKQNVISTQQYCASYEQIIDQSLLFLDFTARCITKNGIFAHLRQSPSLSFCGFEEFPREAVFPKHCHKEREFSSVLDFVMTLSGSKTTSFSLNIWVSHFSLQLISKSI